MLLDLTQNSDLYEFFHNDHGVALRLIAEVIDWCDEHLGEHQIDLLYKPSPSGNTLIYPAYRVHVRFLKESQLVHFRLRWGGKPSSSNF